MCVTALAVSGESLRRPELLFCALSWLPKATVQAAVGAIALDYAKTPLEVERGETVLAIAVLSIIATAPLGAVLIAVYGPKLLLKDGDAGDGGGDGGGDSSAIAVPADEQKSTV
jgi:NhaP-type Na+/H+ or K+/H+ antiporter